MTDINPVGGSGDTSREEWCTPAWLCALIGPVTLDPCSSERAHVQAQIRYTKEQNGLRYAKATPSKWRTFINPPYSRGSVLEWVHAYSHTDFIYLLRFDPSTVWFTEIMSHRPYIWFPKGKRIGFEPPPGVDGESNPFPHALYCKEPPNVSLFTEGWILR